MAKEMRGGGGKVDQGVSILSPDIFSTSYL
jgi:hypothetical protein